MVHECFTGRTEMFLSLFSVPQWKLPTGEGKTHTSLPVLQVSLDSECPLSLDTSKMIQSGNDISSLPLVGPGHLRALSALDSARRLFLHSGDVEARMIGVCELVSCRL